MTCSLHRGVAARFLDEFERVTELLVANEGLGTPTSENRRWFPIYGFPYSVIYRSLQPGIRGEPAGIAAMLKLDDLEVEEDAKEGIARFAGKHPKAKL